MTPKQNGGETPQSKFKDESDSDEMIPKPQPRRTRYLLSLDGGGVRGLASLAVLDELMRLIDPVKPPKPCQVFDMIGGTSTGGLIAVMLGRLEMSVNDSIKAYRSLASRSFTRKSGWPFPFVFHWGTLSLNPQYRYDSTGLENVIKELVKWKLNNEDALLLERDPQCKIFVCATSAIDYYTTRIFQNYGNPENSYVFPDIKIWEACRATSAAPGFFEPITIHYGNHYRDTFRDGATGCNNPVDEVYENARKLWPEDDFCMISIGTGRPVKYDWGDNLTDLIRVLIKISTETERTARNFVLTHPKVPYFRFNVENGVGEIGLHEHEKADQILADSQNFLERHNLKKELRECADILKGGEMYETHYQEICLAPAFPDIQFELVAKAGSALVHVLRLLLFLVSIVTAAFLMLPTSPARSQVEPLTLNLTWPVFAVIGRTGAGKSSFIKTLNGRHIETMELPNIGDSLKSCTDQISWFRATVDEKPLYLIDTPGFDDDHLDDDSILKMIWDNFKNATSMKDRHVTGIILLHDITQQRVGGAMLRNMDSLQDLLGHDDLYRLALITTRWTDNVDSDSYDKWVDREYELTNEYWKDLVEAGAEVMRYDGTLQRATIIIQQLIINREKKYWSKPRPSRSVTKPSKPTETPSPTTALVETKKRWFWRTGWQFVMCIAVLGLTMGSAVLFDVKSPSTSNDILGNIFLVTICIFILLVIKWLIPFVSNIWQWIFL